MGVFLRDPNPYVREFHTKTMEKTTESSEQLGRQTLPRFEPGTSHLPALTALQLHHWWGLLLVRKQSRGIFVLQEPLIKSHVKSFLENKLK